MSTPDRRPPLHVGIDGRAFSSPAAGIRRYARGLTRALAALPDIRVTVIGGDAGADGVPDGVARVGEAWHLPGNPGWVLTGLPRTAARARVDVLHALAYTAPFLAPMPVAVTVHDVSYARHPEWYPHQRDAVRRAYYRISATRADAVITPSHFSASEIQAAYGIRTDRIAVVPMAVEAAFAGAGPDADAPLPDGVRDPFALHVGDIHARRSPDVVLAALAALAQRGGPSVQLVLAGVDRGEVAALASRAPGCVLALGTVDEGVLTALYRRAALLVYPSRYEGFGFPIIEAMAAGLPVVASNAASMPEVAGDAALLVDPEDADGWAGAVTRLLHDGALRADLVARGRARAGEFTWGRTARLTADVYRRLVRA
ncbi:MAG: glycosyltransferase family 4 protein [Vicinamibacterales bacterium]